MSLTAGTVSVDGSGVVSGAGLARARYDAWLAALPSGLTTALTAAGQLTATKQQKALDINAQAAADVAYLTANAEVTQHIAIADVGLQTTTGLGAPTGPHAIPNPGIPLATKGTIA